MTSPQLIVSGGERRSVTILTSANQFGGNAFDAVPASFTSSPETTKLRLSGEMVTRIALDCLRSFC